MHHSTTVLVALLSVAVASMILGSLALAHSGATGVVKDRMDMMKGMGKAMKEMAAIFRGKKKND